MHKTHAVNSWLLWLVVLLPWVTMAADPPPPLVRSVLSTNLPAFGTTGQALFRLGVSPYLSWSNAPNQAAANSASNSLYVLLSNMLVSVTGNASNFIVSSHGDILITNSIGVGTNIARSIVHVSGTGSGTNPVVRIENFDPSDTSPTLSLGNWLNAVYPSIWFYNAGNRAPFTLGSAGSTFNGVFDATLSWGFNTRNNARIVNTAPMLNFTIESDYFNGGLHGMEWNVDFTTSNGLTNARPLYFYIDGDGGPSSSMLWSFAIGDSGTDASKFTIMDATRTHTLFTMKENGSVGWLSSGFETLTRGDDHTFIDMSQTNPATYNIDLSFKNNGSMKWLQSVRTTSSNDMWFYSNTKGSSVLTLEHDTGNVGIMNDNPAQALDVTGNFLVSGNQTNQGNLAFGNAQDVALYRSGVQTLKTDTSMAIAGTLLCDTFKGYLGGNVTFSSFADAIFSNSGKMGIGTNSPQSREHVTADNSVPYIAQWGTTNRPQLMTLSTNGDLFVDGNVTNTRGLWFTNVTMPGGGGSGITVSNQTNMVISFGAGTINMNSNGWVSINKVNPQAILDVNGSISASSFRGGIYSASYINDGSGTQTTWQTTTNGLQSEKMRLAAAGWLGVGTNSPLARLDVIGDNANTYIIRAGKTNDPYLMTLSTNGVLSVNPGGGLNPVGCYGSLMMNATNIVVCAGAASVYTNVCGTGFTTIVTNGFFGNTAAIAAGLTNLYAGWYRVTISVSALGANNQATEWEIVTNGVACDLVGFKKTYDAASRMDALSATGTIYLPALCGTQFMVQDGGTGASIAVHRAALNIGTP